MQPIHRSLFVIALAATLAAPAYAAAPASKKGGSGFKCWTNEEGVQECGNAIPPEYSQEENRTVGKHGVTVDSQSRAKTPEERAAEEQRAREAASKAAEEQRLADQRQKADQVLLSTFASEQDIIMARDRKLTAIAGTIEVTNISMIKQKQVVENFRNRIANLEKTGKPVPPEMTADMATEQQKLDNKVNFLAAKRAEVESLKAEYEGYLNRYRELMTQRSGAR